MRGSPSPLPEGLGTLALRDAGRGGLYHAEDHQGQGVHLLRRATPPHEAPDDTLHPKRDGRGETTHRGGPV